MYLMLVDTEVLYFDLNDYIVEEIRPDLTPFSLRDGFKKDRSVQSIKYNNSILKSYLSSRIIMNYNRQNANNICKIMCIQRLNNIDSRVQACIAYKGLSIQDSYWIKSDNSTLKFNDVNIRRNNNSFKEIVNIALFGEQYSIHNQLNQELTTHGCFRKAWIKEKNNLYLLKSDNHSYKINTKMEVLASEILKCFDNKIDCIEYTLHTINGLTVSKCKNFVDERYSFIEAWELIEYCNRVGINFREKFIGHSSESASIAVLDFIISNTDRHTQNYGFLMNNKTGKVEKIAPLFDFNYALVADALNKDASDTLSQMFNTKETLKQLAEQYLQYSNLALNIDKFNDVVKQNKQYEYILDKVFERCKQLKIL